MQPHSSQRLDYLDGVRAFALILGIIFHASLSFVPVFIGWAVMDVSTSHWVTTFIHISHSFRMPLFFMLAGYFSHKLLGRQGTCIFARSRLVRLGIPFICGWFLLRPLLAITFTMGMQSMRGDVELSSSLLSAYDVLRQLPTGLFIGTHLWFLYYLIVITALWLVIRKLFSKLSIALPKLWVTILSVITLSTFCLWHMSYWGIDTPDKSLFFNVPVLGLYSGYFILGAGMAATPERLSSFTRFSVWPFLLAIIAIIVSIKLSVFERAYGHSHYFLIKLTCLLCYAIMTWALVQCCLIVARACLNRPNKTIRYVSDSAYWMYLIHLPIVIALQVLVAEWPLYWWLKLSLVCLFTIICCLLSYAWFVRSTWLGRLLTGKRLTVSN